MLASGSPELRTVFLFFISYSIDRVLLKYRKWTKTRVMVSFIYQLDTIQNHLGRVSIGIVYVELVYGHVCGRLS